MIKEKYSPPKTVHLCLPEKHFMLLQFLYLNLHELKLSKAKKSVSQSPLQVLSWHV